MERLSLWQQYKKTKDPKIKGQLIESYVDLVKVVAGRLYTTYGTNVEYDDLVSYGIFGLMDAIDKFELDKNVKFETYAQIRIRGAIIDQLRNMDWIPRSVRQKAKAVDAAYHKLENSLGRSVTDQEIAGELGITLQEHQQVMQQINNFNVVSLEEKLIEGFVGNIREEEEQLPENMLCTQETYENLKQSVDMLPERERQVIALYYYEELTYKEIGAVLGISESRVSQLHSKGISRLKAKLDF